MRKSFVNEKLVSRKIFWKKNTENGNSDVEKKINTEKKINFGAENH